jgi:trans-aconitate methyltransferase
MNSDFTSYLRASIVVRLKPKFQRVMPLKCSPSIILDIGIANQSYRECKSVFPRAVYHGLDHIDTGIEFEEGDRFLLRDLEKIDALIDMPANYDLILVNHVLEHLTNGQEVFVKLCSLLSPGGVLYAEFPSLRTAYAAKRSGSYHFHDDPTHRTFYHLEDLANLAITGGCRVVSCGPVSTPLKNLLSVPRAVIGWARGQGYGPYLLHLQRKIDHILVRRL